MTTLDEPRSILSPRLRGTSVGLLVLVTLIAFEAMAVGAALPTAARDLHGLGSFGWAFTGFLVANIVGMVASGQLSDARGPRQPVILGLICFVAGLLLAGTAATMAQLVAGRVVQGLGGGFLITAVYVVIGEAYPERLRPPVFAAISGAWVVPSLLGPILSGLLAEHASWRWVFLGLVPFTVGGGLLLLPTLRRLVRPTAPAQGIGGSRRILHACAVALGVAALEAAGQHPSIRVVAVAAVGLVAVVWGLRTLLPPGTYLVRPGVAAPVALRGLLAGAFFGVESVVPLSLQLQHRFSATVAGLPLAISGLSWAIGSWWQGREVPGEGPRRRIGLVRAGFVCVTLAALGMAATSLRSAPGWLAYPSWLVAGLGAGLTMSTVGVLLLAYTTDDQRGADSAALQLSDATLSALTTGVAGVLVAAAAQGTIGTTAAFVALDVTMAAIAVIGVLVAGRARPAGYRVALGN